MTNAKQLFLRKDRDGKQSVSQWWASVIHDERFDMVLTCARAEIMEMTPTQSQIEGAAMFSATLMSLSENEPDFTEFPTPGLHHKMPEKTFPTPPTQSS